MRIYLKRLTLPTGETVLALATEEARAERGIIEEQEKLEYELSKAAGREQLAKAKHATQLREKTLRHKNLNYKPSGKLRLEKEIQDLNDEKPVRERAFADAKEEHRVVVEELQASRKHFKDTFFALDTVENE